jgi:hypothetical protein
VIDLVKATLDVGLEHPVGPRSRCGESLRVRRERSFGRNPKLTGENCASNIGSRISFAAHISTRSDAGRLAPRDAPPEVQVRTMRRPDGCRSGCG